MSCSRRAGPRMQFTGSWYVLQDRQAAAQPILTKPVHESAAIPAIRRIPVQGLAVRNRPVAGRRCDDGSPRSAGTTRQMAPTGQRPG